MRKKSDDFVEGMKEEGGRRKNKTTMVEYLIGN